MGDQNKFTSKLRNDRVLIIGGTSGIGYAVAEASLENGAHITISSSNPQRVTAAIHSLKSSYPSLASRITGFPCDLGTESTLEANLLTLLTQTPGPLDHIIYTAGDSIPPSKLSSVTLEKIHSAATVRYTAPIFLAKHATNFCTPGPKSSITLTTGVVSDRPMPDFSVIAGPRAGVVALARNLALDLRPIRVNVVSVGAVDTPTWAHLTPEARERIFSTLMSRSATGRVAKAEDVAEAYIYCMKDWNVTGSKISSDGGTLLM